MQKDCCDDFAEFIAELIFVLNLFLDEVLICARLSHVKMLSEGRYIAVCEPATLPP